MTTVEDAQSVVHAPTRRGRLLERPRSTTGLFSWVTTVDHKKIAILYGSLSLFFFLAGGVERTTGGAGGMVRIEIGAGLLVIETEVAGVDLDEPALVDLGQRDGFELVGLHRLEVVGPDFREFGGLAQSHAQALTRFLKSFTKGLHTPTFSQIGRAHV